MRLILRLAWRNIGRNRRRSGLTIASAVFAVFLVVFFVAMAAGVHEKMIEDAVRVHSGHLTLTGPGYLETRTLESHLHLGPELTAILETTPGIRGFAPRVTTFALLARKERAVGVATLGLDPIREGTVSTLPDRVVDGRFLDPGGSREMVLGRRLADNLGAELGDELLLYSAAWTLETALDLFTLVGVIRFPEPAVDRSLAIISLRDAQDFLAFGDRVTEVAVLAEDPDRVPQLAATLRAAVAALPEPVPEVHPWQEVMPELVHFIVLDDAGMYITLAILVVVVGFGILNTLLMAVLERQREFGVLLALGLPPGRLFALIYAESLVLAGIGLALGLALALPAVLWFQAHPVPLTGAAAGATELFGIEPVLTWKLKPMNPVGSILTLLGVAAVAAVHPALRAARARPVDALRSL